MKLLMNHVTRMKPGFICVAGIDLATNQHVRPDNGTQIERNNYRPDGNKGVYEIGAVVDIGKAVKNGNRPEIEDHTFIQTELKFIEKLKPSEFWKKLEKVGLNSLEEIFGSELKPSGQSMAIPLGKGKASLGVLLNPAVSSLELDPWGKIRIHFSDGKYEVSLSVTDVRLFKQDQKEAKVRLVNKMSKKFPEAKVMLSVGLARPWQKPGDDQQRHWLQVNNIHFEESPIWDDEYF